MAKKYNDIENRNIEHNADWSTFKDSLELSQEELAQIDLKVGELGFNMFTDYPKVTIREQGIPFSLSIGGYNSKNH